MLQTQTFRPYPSKGNVLSQAKTHFVTPLISTTTNRAESFSVSLSFQEPALWSSLAKFDSAVVFSVGTQFRRVNLIAV
jgi:hypothetical protein